MMAQNFLALCACGAYDGTKFHRYVSCLCCSSVTRSHSSDPVDSNMKGFMVQGGDPTDTGKGGDSIWGGAIEDEFHPQNRVSGLCSVLEMRNAH